MRFVLSRERNGAGDRYDSVVLLGGLRMHAASQEADGPSRDERIQRALALLNEALQIIDDLEEFPAVGARLCSVVEALNDESTPAA